MGTQCSCASLGKKTLQSDAKYQINDEQTNPQSAQFNNQMINSQDKSNKQLSTLQQTPNSNKNNEKKTTIIKQGSEVKIQLDETSSNSQKQSNQQQPPAMIQAMPQRKMKQKKLVQLLIPQTGQSVQENKDHVTFLSQEELTKAEEQLIINTLGNHFILSQLSPLQTKYLVKKMRICRAEKQTYVFKQGDDAFSYYVIIKGKCRVEIDGSIKRYLTAGDAFGDLGIIYNAPRSASIFAQTMCILVELNSTTFRKIISDINAIYQRENKQILQKIEFFSSLTEPQKNSLASNCLTQIYQVGKIIFNKGDAANAFYIIQQGIVTILQKNIDLKPGDHVGVNAILTGNQSQDNKNVLVRSNSLIAKTSCKLLSLTRQTVLNTLGGGVQAAIRKNLISKILKQSLIWDMYNQSQWAYAIQMLTFTKIKKMEKIFEEGFVIQPLNLYIVLKSDARSKSNPKSIFYVANSIIEQNRVYKKQKIVFQDDFYVQNEAQVVKLVLQKQIAKQKQKPKKVSNKKLPQILKSINNIQSSGSGPALSSLANFIVLRKLRAGNFGKVYACYNRTDNAKYAIKVMNRNSLLASNVLSYIERQAQILETLEEHPFLVKFMCKIQEQGLIMLIMELIQGEDLFDAVNSRLPLKYPQYKLFICQLILIIEHIHATKTLYRDLKPENIMLCQDGYLKLVDMGTAKQLTLQSRFKTMTIIGTPHYMAPEIILGKGYSFGVDWWSLGVMMYQMVCGRLPYGENVQDPFGVYQEVIKNQLVWDKLVNIHAQGVISQFLIKNPSKRLRNGSSQLKNMQFFKDINWQKILKKKYEPKIFPSRSSVISPQQIERILGKKKIQPAMNIFVKQKDNRNH